LINARTGFIKNSPNIEGDKAKFVIAFDIWTIFNRTSSGIYKLAFKKIIIFLESRKDLPL